MEVAPKSKPGTRVFDFTKILRCGHCGSGITAQEKVKHSGARYIYYHCTKARDPKCSQAYVREEIIIEELIGLLEQTPIDIIKAETSLGEKLEIFRQFSSLQPENREIDSDQIALSKFLGHIFKDGSRKEKRELIACIKGELYLNERQIIVK